MRLKLFSFQFLLALLLCGNMLGATAAPQDPPGRLPFQSYGREAGLGQLRINLLAQDGAGFVWAGTDRGMYRFDGQRFKAFGVLEGLPSNIVNAVHVDAKGGLWVGTSKGLARWNGMRFEAPPPGLPAEVSIEELISGPQGGLWVGTKAGPYRSGPDGFTAVPGWRGGPAVTLALASDGETVWIAERRNLWTWTKNDGLKPTPALLSLTADESIHRLVSPPGGRLLLRSSRATYVLDADAKQFEPIPNLPRAETFLSRPHVSADGAVWLPTEHGVFRYQEGKVTSIGLANGLPTDFARSVLIDREGNLWCGSLGLHRLMGLGAWRSYTPKDGLPGEVWALRRARDGQLWIGTGKGLARAVAGEWQAVTGSEAVTVRTVVELPDGSLIFGGEPYHLWRWDARRGQLQMLPALPEGGRKVMSLALDSKGTLWIGTQMRGLVRGTQAGGHWSFNSVALPGAIANERISDLRIDTKGQLWAASSAGLLLRQGDNWQRLGKEQGLLSNQVAYVAPSASGDLWLAYLDLPGVVSRWRPSAEGGSVVQHIKPPALPAVDIAMIGEDNRGRLWVGASLGLDMLSPTDPRLSQDAIHFGVEHGLVDEEINARAFLAETDGSVWIGTRGGLAQFTSANFHGNPAPPQVGVLQASLGEQSINLSGAVAEQEPGTPRLEVSHQQNTFEVSFSGLSFLDHAGLEYESRLLGLGEPWHANPTREARYAGLAPGDYSMELRARYRSGDWGPTRVIAFSINPPWWQTWWFRISLALSGLALLVVVDRRRQAAQILRTQSLEQLVTERTLELENANATLLALSLTDPLTQLHNRRYLSEVMSDHVAMVDRLNSANAFNRLRDAAVSDGLQLIMVDLDNFKTVNDTYGHQAGDLVLQQVAQLLRECTRESDTVARWGGEEFAIVGRNASVHEAGTLVERIRSRVDNHEFDLGDGRTTRRSCSVGFALYPFFAAAPHRLNWESLFALADQCLYVAKRSGRNTWVGVLPRNELVDTAAKVDAVCQRLESDLAGLVAEGLLQVQSSRAESELNWDSA